MKKAILFEAAIFLTIVVIGLGSYHLFFSQNQITFSYSVTIDAKSHQPVVRLQIESAKALNSLLLQGFIPNRILGLNDIRVIGNKACVITYLNDKTVFEYPKIQISNIKTNRLLIEYHTNSRDNITREYIGSIDEKTCFLTGNNLFLLPENQNNIELSYSFEKPKNHEIIDWKEAYTTNNSAELLSTVFLSSMNLNQQNINNIKFLNTSDRVDSKYINKLTLDISELIQRVATIFPNFTKDLPTVVFCERPDGNLALSMPITKYVFYSTNPDSTMRMIDLCKQLLVRVMAKEPSLNNLEAEMQWLPKGIKNYLAVKIVSTTSSGKRYGELLVESLYNNYTSQFEINIEHYNSIDRLPPVSKLNQALGRRKAEMEGIKIPALMFLLDNEIKKSSKGNNSIEDMITKIVKGKSPVSLSTLDSAAKSIGYNRFHDFSINRILSDNFSFTHADKLFVNYHHFKNVNIQALNNLNVVNSKTLMFRLVISDSFSGRYFSNPAISSGGYSKLASAIKAFFKPNITLLIDAGDFLPDLSNTAKFNIEEVNLVTKLMNNIGYSAAVASLNENIFTTKHGTQWLNKLDFPVASSNPLYEGQSKAISYHTLKGFKIALLGVNSGLPDSSFSNERYDIFQTAMDNSKLTDKIEGLVGKAIADDADFIILVGNLHPVTIRRIVDQVDYIDLVFTRYKGETVPYYSSFAGTTDWRTLNDYYLNDTYIVHSKNGNRGLSIVDAYEAQGSNSSKRYFTAKYLELSEEVELDKETNTIIMEHFQEVENTARSNLDMKPFYSGPDTYKGPSSCSPCHSEYLTSRTNLVPHQESLAILTTGRNNLRPECLQCHTTGYLTNTGFKIHEQRSEFAKVSCEACHGPASEHIKRPGKSHLVIPGIDTCQKCHTAKYGSITEEEFSKFVHAKRKLRKK